MVGMVIADDESIIRQGLMTIPWNELGIHILGVASNGEEALNLVKSTHPQILLTDIRMPGMDGLALVETINDEMPKIKSILLTGHQDFNYAHTAIKLGAFGYVLKPSDPDEIINIVMRAKGKIEEELQERSEREHIRQQFDSVRPVLMNSFLLDMIFQRTIDMSLVEKKCIEFELQLENYTVMLIEFETGDKMKNKGVLSKLNEDIHNIYGGYRKCYVLEVTHTSVCIISEIDEPNETAKDKMLSMAMEIRNNLKAKFDIYVSIGISKCFHNAENLHAAYNQAVNCLKLKFSLGKGAIIHIEDLADSFARQNTLILDMTDEVIENVRAGNYRKVEKLTREILYRLAKELKVDENMIKTVCFDILVSTLRILKEKKTARNQEYNEQKFHEMIMQCSDIEELEERIINALMNIMDAIYAKAPGLKNEAIQSILQYIHEFYMQDISLISVSEHVHMNHIYVSRLIKKETGETFLDILTRIRIQKACELLANQSLRTYEVASMVGIKDSGYFSQIFKKYEGITPSEYKDNLLARVTTHQAKTP